MGNTSKDKEESKFGEYMRELYRSSPEKLPSHAAVCREAKIDRNFYNRVKDDGFQGGVPEPRNVSDLCNAIVLKESLKKPITAQEVLDGLINAGYLPEGSMLESEVEKPETEFDECARLVIQEMQENLTVIQNLDEFEKFAEGKSTQDFGSWK